MVHNISERPSPSAVRSLSTHHRTRLVLHTKENITLRQPHLTFRGSFKEIQTPWPSVERESRCYFFLFLLTLSVDWSRVVDLKPDSNIRTFSLMVLCGIESKGPLTLLNYLINVALWRQSFLDTHAVFSTTEKKIFIGNSRFCFFHCNGHYNYPCTEKFDKMLQNT